MTRKIAFRIALAATPILGLLLYAALNWYELEETKVRTGMSEEAQRDPHLAYRRLLLAMGAQAEHSRSPLRLARPPERGVLMLGTRRLAYMTPQRVSELQAWVGRGGVLVAPAEPPGIDDPLLERFGVEREEPETPRERMRRKGEAAERGEKPAERGEKSAQRRASRPPENIALVAWPGAAKPLRVRQRGLGMRLTGEREPEGLVTAARAGKLVVVAFPAGLGRVVFVSDLGFLNNRAIGQEDHAEFGWRLATAAPAQLPSLVFLRADSPSLWEWLLENAWPVLIGSALLLLAWLARIVPRFGPLEPEAAPVRRSLAEHLRAAGRFVWSRGEARHLIDALRDRTWRTALRRRGGLKGLAHSRAEAALGEMAGCPLAIVQRAMHGNDTSPAAFVATALALQQVEAGLAHRSMQPPRKGKTR